MRPIVEHVHGTIVECNTAYEGARNTTEKHQRLIKDYGWTDYFPVDIMDAESLSFSTTDYELVKLD